MQVVKIEASPKTAAAHPGRRKAESRSEAAGTSSEVSAPPDLLLGILHLRCQPLDQAVQLVALILGSAKVLTLLAHRGFHLLALWVGGPTLRNSQWW